MIATLSAGMGAPATARSNRGFHAHKLARRVLRFVAMGWCGALRSATMATRMQMTDAPAHLRTRYAAVCRQVRNACASTQTPRAGEVQTLRESEMSW